MRVNFARWYLERSEQDVFFFTDEATFGKEGPFNTRNQHEWALENPHATLTRRFQERLSVNIWAEIVGIVGDVLVVPYMLPQRLDGASYLEFLRNVLPYFLWPGCSCNIKGHRLTTPWQFEKN